jgi:hypothetical protein
MAISKINTNSIAPSQTLVTPVISGLMDLQGGQIKFPTSQVSSFDANTLDDYEEGTWTPVLTASAGTITSQSGFGSYIKIGKQVTLTFRVAVVSGTITQIGNITGFPFTQENTNQVAVGASRETNNTGFMWEIVGSPNNTLAQLIQYNNSSSVTSGYAWNGTFTYIAIA